MKAMLSKHTLGISVLVGLVCYYGSSVVRARADAGKPVANSFEASTAIKMFMDDGTLAFQKSRHYARFHDGSIEFGVQQTFPKREGGFTEILNVSKGQWQFTDDVTKSVMTIHESPEKIMKTLSEMQEACPAEDLRALPAGGMILGFKTSYRLEMVEAGPSKIKDEEWIAPDLGCFRLKRIETNGTGLNHNEEIATAVAVGEPPAALLIVPTSFVERDPAAINELHQTATGLPYFHELPLKRFRELYRNGR